METIKRLYSLIEGYVGFLALKNPREMSLGSVLEKQAAKYDGKDLILFEDKKITFKEFNEAANRFSHLLQKRGFIKGDTIVLLMDNRPEFLIIHAGLAKIGVIPALVNNNITGQILAHAINIADARAVIIGHEYLPVFMKIKNKINLKKPGSIFVETEKKKIKIPAGYEDISLLTINEPVSNPVVMPPINSKDTLEYIYTSGTTGMPKATELKHQKWLQLGYGAGGISLRAIDSDVQYCCLPLYHNSGINIAWSTSLIHGAALALRRKFSASAFWDDVRKYNATLFVYIGELCRYLNNQPVKTDDRNNPLRFLLGNGMRGDYWVEFQKRFGIEKIVEVYGATEGVGALTNLKGVPGMIGKLTVGGIRMGEVVKYDIENDIITRDDRGYAIKCSAGETGLFLARISNINPFSGYKNNKQATNDKIINDVFKKGDAYFNSGDLFALHRKDYVSFVDRLGDTFKWKGEVVATNEVSDVISRFGGIEDSNVYGVPVKNAEGRAGMAAITPLTGAAFNHEKFAAYICGNLPAYARPYFIRITKVKDATTSFKQVKSRLQNEGFNPEIVKDTLYFLEPEKCRYIKLTKKIYQNIQSGMYRF